MLLTRPSARPGRRGARPATWCTGPDPVQHAQYVAFGRARAQAHYRGEAWQLTFDQFRAIWGADWPRRGRAAQDLCMTRLDPDLEWSPANVELISRGEHNRRAAFCRLQLR